MERIISDFDKDVVLSDGTDYHQDVLPRHSDRGSARYSYGSEHDENSDVHETRSTTPDTEEPAATGHISLPSIALQQRLQELQQKAAVLEHQLLQERVEANDTIQQYEEEQVLFIR